jgi:RNA polymerase sigma-70 factor (ECF subfamily)
MSFRRPPPLYQWAFVGPWTEERDEMSTAAAVDPAHPRPAMPIPERLGGRDGYGRGMDPLVDARAPVDARAEAGAAEEFGRLAEPFRRELLALCYRMLGSLDEAEDAVQETYLSAWRSYAGFEGRASLRTWLYRIATRACLKALERGVRRPLPSGLGGPSEEAESQPVRWRTDIAWLQPMPTGAAHAAGPGSGAAADPAVTVAARRSMRLAFVAALQYLPPRQRAVLILRDVLAWRSGEVAELIGSSEAAVNSALQRARAQLKQVAPTEDGLVEPRDRVGRGLLDRYATAFEAADVAALTALLARDAVFEMPPIPIWFAGRQSIARFLAARVLRPDHFRLLATEANDEPAFGLYERGADGVYLPHAVQVVSLADGGVARIVTFHDPALLARFGLPPTAGRPGPGTGLPRSTAP